ncbi:MAG: hypothetical protein [Bacteriophage sp.]|nr:MAG: hypothetical protein [Bacteriophage sp.]
MTDTPVNRNTEMTADLAKCGLDSLDKALTMLKAAKIASRESMLSGGLNRVQIAAMHELESYPDMLKTKIDDLSCILRIIQTGEYGGKSGDDE